MNNGNLHQLAAGAGVQRRWTSASGEVCRVADDDLRALLGAMGWPCASASDIRDSLHRQRDAAAALPPLATTTSRQPELPQGLHGDVIRIAWEQGGALEWRRNRDGTFPPLPPDVPTGYHRLLHADGEITLAVAPSRCFGIGDLAESSMRLWGPVVQVPSLRGRDDAGFGDFASLSQCAGQAAAAGAGALAISPVHALFLSHPAHCAPYSPSSRHCLNALYADPHVAFADAVVRAARAATAMEADPATGSSLIDWPAGSRRKLALLKRLYTTQAAGQAKVPLRYDPDDPVHVHACFEALQAHLSGQHGPVLPLPDWPRPLHSPRASAVREFAQTHADALRFHIWLQHLARQSLAQVQQNARDAGMPVGLIVDLAVGSHPDGSDMWAQRSSMLPNVGIGAPPDPFNSRGQAWGLATFSPWALRRQGYAPWLGMLRANLLATGGIRIDHAMGLARQWLVSHEREATHGAYVHMPAEDLLRLLALESWRHRTLVIGEDLGTVPASLRRKLRDRGLLGMSVLWFERAGEAPLPPACWSRRAVAMSGTHDLPTLAGWWRGRDLERQARLHRSTPPAVQRRQRQHERTALWQALHVRPGNAAPTGKACVEPPPEKPAAFIDAACAALAASPAPLVLMPMEDLAGVEEQVNQPGTTDAYPNWRHRSRDRVDRLFQRADVRHRLHLLTQGRAS